MNRPSSLMTRDRGREAHGPRPVNVCFMIDRLGAAGTEMQLLAVIAEFDRRRLRPHLCLLDGMDEESRSLEPPHCPILRLGIRRLRSAGSLAAAMKFTRFLRANRIEGLQVHFRDSTYFGVPFARLAGVKHVVLTRFDSGYWVTDADRRLGRWVARLAEAAFANSDEARRSAITDYTLDPDRVLILNNGVDLSRYARPVVRSGSAAKARGRSVGLVANLRPVKDPECFIRAAGILAPRHPDVTFLLAGSGELRSPLEQLCGDLGIVDRVRFQGSVSDMPAFLSGLNVAVLCSRSEGLSNALLEYMAAGLPIVASAVGGNTSLIDEGVHGLLVPPQDPASLAQAIERLLGDPHMAGAMGRAAQDRVRHHYSLEVKARGLEDFYQRLCNPIATVQNPSGLAPVSSR